MGFYSSFLFYNGVKAINAIAIIQNLNELIFTLSEKELDRTGVHKKYGDLNIVQWIEFFLLHEAHHLFTIFQLTNDTDLK